MKELVVVLDNIRSVQNVGSIFRTSDGAGFKKIFLVGVTPTPLDRFGRFDQQFSKVALGAEKTVAWEKSASLVRTLNRLKKEGFRIIAIEQHKSSQPLSGFKPIKSGRYAVVMGSEVEGLPLKALALCDTILEIPMRGMKESLNVSVAFGIAAYKINP